MNDNKEGLGTLYMVQKVGASTRCQPLPETGNPATPSDLSGVTCCETGRGCAKCRGRLAGRQGKKMVGEWVSDKCATSSIMFIEEGELSPLDDNLVETIEMRCAAWTPPLQGSLA